MTRAVLALLTLSIAAPCAFAQGIVGDVFAGKLINPEVGVYAWYDLTDKATGSKLFLRQAVVGEEKVKRKTGHWVETEIIPEVGYAAIYKMLLTGPASDAKNVHKILAKEGVEPAQSLPVDFTDDGGKSAGQARKSLGMEKVATAQGEVEAEHVVLGSGEATVDVWLSDAVRPMGIVKMVSPEGELLLNRHGTGGPDGQSKIDAAPAAPLEGGKSETRVEVRVETENGKTPAPGRKANDSKPPAKSADKPAAGKSAGQGKAK